MNNQNPMNKPLLYAFDAGNGSCKGISSECRKPIQFEPTIAPLTNRRGLIGADKGPTYSLREDTNTLVFGIQDVVEYGKQSAVRRLNSQERYTSQDFFRLLSVLFLHAFPAIRGNTEPIVPVGTISVPIVIYNNTKVVDVIKDRLCGTHEVVDGSGQILRIHIDPQRLLIIPESYGALMHHAYDPATLQKRTNIRTSGTTLVIDIGYETTDLSLFENLRFRRDRAESIRRAGMGVVARAVQDYAGTVVRETDISRIDRALQKLAGRAPGTTKVIQPSPGVRVDVTVIYDQEIETLAARIAQEVLTRFPDSISRILLAGGGAYHLCVALQQHLPNFPIEIAPDADMANTFGGFTVLQQEMLRRSR